MKVNKRKLQLAMAEKEFSAKHLSEVCGLSPATITKISNDQVEARPGTVGKIAKALNVPVTDIVDMEE